jgi:signal transduction histidine kinase
MRLSKFILAHLADILKEWDAFARTLDTGTPLTELALRDHARPILEAIAKDMAEPETPREQYDKSRGLEPVDTRSAASTHGTLRHMSGFSLVQLAAEFRALRATVLRLWLPRVQQFDALVASDMVRFNETIDQALAESVLTYSNQGLRTRDTFLAMLGHDLRSPLSAISLASQILGRQELTPDIVERVATTLQRSSRSMTAMVDDLLEYARLQLGGPIPVDAKMLDMVDFCGEAIEDARAAHPDRSFHFQVAGELHCKVDAARLRQVLANLLNNAAQYSSPGRSISLSAEGSADAVTVRVRNFGSVIPEAEMESIFNPLVQLQPDANDVGRGATSIGLGLYIAREITLAHGGSIDVTSSALDGTVFSVRLPKMLAAQEFSRVAAGSP